MKVLQEIEEVLASIHRNLDKMAYNAEMERKIGLDLCQELEKMSLSTLKMSKEINEINQFYGG